MTMKKLLDEIARNWGLEDPNTIKAFNMAERGETVQTMKEFKDLVESAMGNDENGFDF